MHRALAIATLVVGAFVLAGCAAGSPEERAAFCDTADWREYGFNDGRLGVPAGERADFFAECRELGDPPDVEAYRAGRAEGLQAYCTLENGYEVGLAGRRYRGVCPPESEIAFLQGYEQGRKERGRHYRAYPRFSFGFGVGSYHPHSHWWFGHRYPLWGW